MQAERDELVKRVFPALRKLCEARGVSWSEVDLRWGITDEQRAEGRILPICLEEIRGCRPYFIGLLGERYGWVPENLPPALLETEPWLGAHAGRSVTELEILHGVLNNPAMAGNAFFYFRDPKFLDTLAPEQRRLCEEGALSVELERFGKDGAEKRVLERRARLSELKSRIRASGLPLKENYAGPQELGELVLAQMTEVIERLFPAGSKPASLERERWEHEAFAGSRRRVYIAPEGAFARLDAHARGNGGEALVVRGESGSGKSALLANWSAEFARMNPGAVVIGHFVGASARGAELPSLLMRLAWELKELRGVPAALPAEEAGLSSAFANCLHQASAGGGAVLVIDGLDQLEDHQGALDLAWLPPALPDNVRFVLSTAGGATLQALRRRNWPELGVAALAPQERRELIAAYLAQYRKSLAPAHVERLVAAEPTGSPLYLRALLEELRLHGRHETLGERIEHYLTPAPGAAASPADLFGKILARCEEDFETERGNLLLDAMSNLWASRGGLSEHELLELMGGIEGALPRAFWSPIWLTLEHSLSMSGGLLRLGHEFLRKAVEDRYLYNEELKRGARQWLAVYFMKRELSSRKALELPWQWAKLQQWDRLHELLTDPEFVRVAWEADKSDVFRYWSSVEGGSAHRMADAYAGVILDPGAAQENYHWLHALLYETGNLESASLLNDTLISGSFEYDSDPELEVGWLNNQGSILGRLGNLDRAMHLLKEAEGIARKEGNTEGLRKALGNQSGILAMRDELEESLALNQEVARLCREAGDKHGLRVSLDNQAVHLIQRGELDAAERLLREAESLCRELGDKEGLQGCLGLKALASRKRGDHSGALALLKDRESICRELGNRPGLRVCLRDQAVTLDERGDSRGALALLEEVESLCRELGDKRALSGALSHRFKLLSELKDFAGAQAAVSEAEVLERELGGAVESPQHLGEQALGCLDRGELDRAMALFRKQEELIGEFGDKKMLAACLGGQGMVLNQRGDADGAMAVFQRQEQVCRGCGERNLLAACLGEQAKLLKARREWDRALALLKEGENIFSELGEDKWAAGMLREQAEILDAQAETSPAQAGETPGAKTLTASFQALGRWLSSLVGGGPSLGKALAGRDLVSVNELLAAARKLAALAYEDYTEQAENLALDLLCGRYEKARALSESIFCAALSLKETREFAGLKDLLKVKIPAKDWPLAAPIARATAALVSSPPGDPFQAQLALSELLQGIEARAVPLALHRLQTALAEKASWLARRRGEERSGAAPGPAPADGPAWAGALYELPIPALEPLRKALSRAEFERRVAAEYPPSSGDPRFPWAHYWTLLERMGFTGQAHRIYGPFLEDLLQRHGSLLLSMAWYDADVSGMEENEARSRLTEELTLLTGASDAPGERLFVTRDARASRETRYTAVELGLLCALALTVEPAGPGARDALMRFLSEGLDLKPD